MNIGDVVTWDATDGHAWFGTVEKFNKRWVYAAIPQFPAFPPVRVLRRKVRIVR